MKGKKVQLIALGIAAGTVLCNSLPVMAATSHYTDASTAKSEESWSEWVQEWNDVANDYTKVTIQPGRNETELNFCWMTQKDAKKNKAVVYFGTKKNNLKAYTGVFYDADSYLTGDVQYVSNKVTIKGLKENTTYYYNVVKNGVPSGLYTYTTKDFDDVKMLLVGDPQIGASKKQPQGNANLVEENGAANTAARNDAFDWNRTLSIADGLNPDTAFIISAGDQVNKTGKAKEEEYAGFLNADILHNVPLATTIGNHDSLNSDYTSHFYVPNATKNGLTAAGGDYYYSYGNGLFIVLNTNNYNVAEHKATIEEAVASDPGAQWRIVTIHQDIYGAGLDHSETDGMILRTQLTPLFDQYDIDVCLQGHDHSYCRSKMLYGDGQTHDSYKFRLNEAGDDYDWDHAFDTTTNENVSLYPEDGDKAAADRLQQFRDDNHCYTIEDTQGNTVTDPQGTLYITANSATGSKYYELNTTQQDYIAKRSQNWLPSYSVIEMTANEFKIDTYQITDDNSVEQLDDEFTIVKTR